MDTVDLPKSADQAELMAKVGIAWLQVNAPERLTDSGLETQQLRNRVKELEEANKLLESDASRYRCLKEKYHGFEMFRHSPITLDIEVDKLMENKNEQY